MKTRLVRVLTAFALLLPMLGTSVALTHATPTFADPAFAQLWQQYDGPVVDGSVKRGYSWGPQPNTGPIMEDYAEGAGGKRLVQYFDKGRMEINNPAGDKSSPYYVTGGLLARELVTGQMQVGIIGSSLAGLPRYRLRDLITLSIPTFAMRLYEKTDICKMWWQAQCSWEAILIHMLI